MAINPISTSPVRGSGLVDQATAAKVAELPGSGLPGKPVAEIDQVKLTNNSLRLRQIETQDQEEPPMDQAKIDKLRAAIANGEYRVDSDKLAKKMLDFESSFA